MREYPHLEVRREQHTWNVTLMRPESGNSLNRAMIGALSDCLTDAETDPDARVFVVRGGAVFCAGLDFAEAIQPQSAVDGGRNFFQLLKRFTLSPRMTVAVVTGRTSGGGVGLAAAMDVLIATDQATFTLSEALFGLVPANILPFLVRRLGVHKARLMTLTTRTVDAVEAQSCGLVDELSRDVSASLRKMLLRSVRLGPQTIAANKLYIEQLWPIGAEMELAASSQLANLLRDPIVQAGLRGFVEQGILPASSGREVAA